MGRAGVVAIAVGFAWFQSQPPIYLRSEEMTKRRGASSVKSRLLAAAMFLGVVVAGAASAAFAATGPHGVVLVVNPSANVHTSMPTVEQLDSAPDAVARGLSEAGFLVRTSPDGRCIAASAPATVSDDDLGSADLPPPVLVTRIVDGITSEQMAARFQGYLAGERLSEPQRLAALRIGKRRSLVDAEGRPTEAGTRLSVGIWCTWRPHVVTTDANDNHICRMLDFGIRPPTEPAIAVAPLSGSVLWWAWPYRDADWGDQTVSIEAGTYALDELLERLSAASGIDIVARAPADGTSLAVCADGIRVRELLWAVEVATGLPAEIMPNSDPPIVALGAGGARSQPRYRDDNVLVPVPGLGYYSASQSPGGSDLLMAYPGGPTEKGKHWIGWRFSDLPLLYRNMVQDEWARSCKLSDAALPASLKPDETYVLWVKCVLVSVGAMASDGSGRGGEYPVPAL